MVHIDYLTVIVGAVVYMIIAALWYSKYLFGNMWIKCKGLKNIRNRPLAFVLNFIVAIILAYFLSLIEIYLGATSFWDGVIAGFIIYLGFVFTTQIIGVIWVKNSFKIFLIDNLCYMLSFMVMGGILVG